jgi:pimeloyl-ACP methyl ester carboxylesterase
MDRYADALADLLDALGLEKVVLVGSSMGGVIAQQFALRHPTRLERLLLVATGAFTGDPAGALKKADELVAVPWTDEMVSSTVTNFFHTRPAEPRHTELRGIVRMASPAAVDALRVGGRLHALVGARRHAENARSAPHPLRASGDAARGLNHAPPVTRNCFPS